MADTKLWLHRMGSQFLVILIVVCFSNKLVGLYFAENTSLKIIDVFNVLVINSELLLKDNISLIEVSGFKCLTKLTGRFEIFYNIQLQDCCIFKELLADSENSIDGDILIAGNATGRKNSNEILAIECNTDIEEVQISNIPVYPNPTTAHISINFPKLYYVYEMIDMRGRIVEKYQLYQNSATVNFDMSAYHNVIYLIKFLSQKAEVTTAKVVKN